MRLLLDTHVVLWALADDSRIGSEARRAIEDTRNSVFVSAASAWEIAVKRALGKLEAPSDLIAWIERSAFNGLSIAIEHALASAELPPRHRDPFDRLLVAQSRLESLTLVTGDAQIARYDVATLDATT